MLVAAQRLAQAKGNDEIRKIDEGENDQIRNCAELSSQILLLRILTLVSFEFN